MAPPVKVIRLCEMVWMPWETMGIHPGRRQHTCQCLYQFKTANYTPPAADPTEKICVLVCHLPFVLQLNCLKHSWLDTATLPPLSLPFTPPTDVHCSATKLSVRHVHANKPASIEQYRSTFEIYTDQWVPKESTVLAKINHDEGGMYFPATGFCQSQLTKWHVTDLKTGQGKQHILFPFRKH